MTIDDVFKFVEDSHEELDVNQEHGALLMLGAGQKLSSIVRGKGHNIICAIILSMKNNDDIAELLKDSVRLFDKYNSIKNDDEYSKLRNVLSELRKEGFNGDGYR